MVRRTYQSRRFPESVPLHYRTCRVDGTLQPRFVALNHVASPPIEDDQRFAKTSIVGNKRTGTSFRRVRSDGIQSMARPRPSCRSFDSWRVLLLNDHLINMHNSYILITPIARTMGRSRVPPRSSLTGILPRSDDLHSCLIRSIFSSGLHLLAYLCILHLD